MIQHKKISMNQFPQNKENITIIDKVDEFQKNENLIIKNSAFEKNVPEKINQKIVNELFKSKKDDLFSFSNFSNFSNGNTPRDPLLYAIKEDNNKKINENNLYDQIVPNEIILEEVCEKKKEINKKDTAPSKVDKELQISNEQNVINYLPIPNNTITLVTNINNYFQNIKNSNQIEDFVNFFNNPIPVTDGFVQFSIYLDKTSLSNRIKTKYRLYSKSLELNFLHSTSKVFTSISNIKIYIDKSIYHKPKKCIGRLTSNYKGNIFKLFHHNILNANNTQKEMHGLIKYVNLYLEFKQKFSNLSRKKY